MDRVIPKKTWTKKRLLSIGGVVGLILLISASYYFTAGKSKLNVDTERITISEIKNGSFQEFIPVNGVVLPITTIYLDAVEGGRVEEKFAEDGAVLKKGDPILKMVNTDLELDLANRQTAVFDVLTQMQNTKNLSDQNTIRELNQMAEVDNAFAEAERLYKMNKQ
ncbi:MAG: efflux RND transporter periplasmic adaptor subunit, partial [Chitinophagales bacterium]